MTGANHCRERLLALLGIAIGGRRERPEAPSLSKAEGRRNRFFIGMESGFLAVRVPDPRGPQFLVEPALAVAAATQRAGRGRSPFAIFSPRTAAR